MAVIVWWDVDYEGVFISCPHTIYPDRAAFEADSARLAEEDRGERGATMVALDTATLETHEHDGWKPVEPNR
jgi:hypothetical protein